MQVKFVVRYLIFVFCLFSVVTKAEPVGFIGNAKNLFQEFRSFLGDIAGSVSKKYEEISKDNSDYKEMLDKSNNFEVLNKSTIGFEDQDYRPATEPPSDLANLLGDDYEVVTDPDPNMSEAHHRTGFLGGGAKGMVYLVRDKRSGKVMVVKYANDSRFNVLLRDLHVTPPVPERLFQDIQAAETINPYLETPVNIHVDKERGVLFKDYVKGFTLTKMIEKNPNFFRDKSEALYELRLFILHMLVQGVVFNDMHSDNLMWDTTRSRWVFIDAMPMMHKFDSVEAALEYYRTAILESDHEKVWANLTSPFERVLLSHYFRSEQVETIIESIKTFIEHITMKDAEIYLHSKHFPLTRHVPLY